MEIIKTKEEIVSRLKEVSIEFMDFCAPIPEALFFKQPPEKWSVAQNVNHLFTSAKMTKLAFRLPRFLIRMYTGTPNRPSRSFDELVARYHSKLEQGGRASGQFVAPPVPPTENKQKILRHFNTKMESLIRVLEKKWEDPQLDKYLAPHPLLGKITFRELGFFTIYHTLHHLQTIKERLQD